MAGLAVTLARPRWELGASSAIHAGLTLTLGEASAFARVRAGDRLRLGISNCRRPFLEAADPLATGDAAYFAISSGGATTLEGVARRGVDELNSLQCVSRGARRRHGGASAGGEPET